QGLVWRGRLAELAGEHDRALADFHDALRRDPDHVEARLQLALAGAQESPRPAAEHLQRLHRRDPADRQVRLLLAPVRSGRGAALPGGILYWRAAQPAALPAPDPAAHGPGAAPADRPAAGPPWFRDVTGPSGVRFAYRNGEEADLFTILETVGGGVALIDYDG